MQIPLIRAFADGELKVIKPASEMDAPLIVPDNQLQWPLEVRTTLKVKIGVCAELVRTPLLAN